jgi:hypothetical protein
VWKYINGHDFTYFLQAINQDIAKQYSGRKYGLEYTLINNYDVLSFKSTALYELLAQANLLNI